MNKNLIALLVAFAGLSGAVAHADTLLIERHGYGYDFGGTSFRFDAQNGSAWMEVFLTEDLGGAVDMPHGGPSIRHHNVMAAVKGLSYDAAAAQIVFTATGFTNPFGGAATKIVCATVTEKHGFFGTKSIITLTGACTTYTVTENHGVSVYFEAK